MIAATIMLALVALFAVVVMIWCVRVIPRMIDERQACAETLQKLEQWEARNACPVCKLVHFPHCYPPSYALAE